MGFFEKMKAGLARTRSQMAATINTMIADFTEENEEIYDELEEALILSDAGVETTENIIETLREQVRLRLCVAAHDAEQDQIAFVDRADCCTVHGDRGGRDALDDCFHERYLREGNEGLRIRD